MNARRDTGTSGFLGGATVLPMLPLAAAVEEEEDDDDEDAGVVELRGVVVVVVVAAPEVAVLLLLLLVPPAAGGGGGAGCAAGLDEGDVVAEEEALAGCGRRAVPEATDWSERTVLDESWWPLAEAMAAMRMACACGWAFISLWRDATCVLRFDDWLNFFSQYGHT